MLEGLNNLEKVTNRRKALVWVSEGYDFNPFQESRYGLLRPDFPFLQNQSNQMRNQADPDNPDAQQSPDPLTSTQMQNETFSDADLAYELSEITRAANRANTTIYTLDPRGLVAGRTSTSRSIRRNGASTCAKRRTRCACLPTTPAALPLSTRTTSIRR